MNKYGLTLILKSDVKDGEKFVEKMEKTLKGVDGKVVKFSEMGKKQLAYKINNQSEGTYLSWVLEVPPAGVLQLERKLTLDKEILRHLLVKED